MRKVVISEDAISDLQKYFAYIISKDGIARANSVYDQVLAKIDEVAASPFELGQSREKYIPGLRKLSFKKLNIYFRYNKNTLYIDRIISSYRDQDKQFE